WAIFFHENKRWTLDHHRDWRDVVHRPARTFSSEQRMAIGDIDRHRITVSRRCKKLRHPSRTGATGNVHNRDALTEHRLHEFADEARKLIGATTGAPGNDPFDRPLGIYGRTPLATEQCGTEGQQQNRNASHGRTHGLLPTNRPLACMPCPRPSPAGMLVRLMFAG